MENILNLVNEYSTFIMIGLIVVTLLLLIIILILMSSINKLQSKYRKMMRGIDNTTLEEVINSNIDYIEKALVNSDAALEECKKINETMKSCVNKVAIVRYKAFEDVGSDLSFSIAILDSYNDGVVITGIYSRHDTTTYAKPIDKGTSKYNLSLEEQQVLNEAINGK